MKIVKGYPPNYEDIKKRFTLHKGIVFCYGDTIYSPDHEDIDAMLMCHESVHSRQQGDKIEDWWKRYLRDDDFRFVQELEAYQEQYQYFCLLQKDRNYRSRFLQRLASDLSSEIYGKICSTQEARKAIRENLKFDVH